MLLHKGVLGRKKMLFPKRCSLSVKPDYRNIQGLNCLPSPLLQQVQADLKSRYKAVLHPIIQHLWLQQECVCVSKKVKKKIVKESLYLIWCLQLAQLHDEMARSISVFHRCEQSWQFIKTQNCCIVIWGSEHWPLCFRLYCIFIFEVCWIYKT